MESNQCNCTSLRFEWFNDFANRQFRRFLQRCLLQRFYLFPIKLTSEYRTLQLGPFEFLEASDLTIVRQYNVFGEIASHFSASYLQVQVVHDMSFDFFRISILTQRKHVNSRNLSCSSFKQLEDSYLAIGSKRRNFRSGIFWIWISYLNFCLIRKTLK